MSNLKVIVKCLKWWLLAIYIDGLLTFVKQQSCYKIGNGEYDKETTTRLKSRQQPQATNVSSTERENPASGGGPRLASK